MSIDQLAPILDALPNAAQVANSQGTIVYVNKSFVNLTGIIKEDRIQKNINDLAPSSAMVQALRTHKAVINYFQFIGKEMTEVVASAYPIIVNNNMQGVVEVLHPLSEHVMALDQMEKIMIQRALDIYGRTMKGKLLVAESLNISLATLYNKIKKYKI